MERDTITKSAIKTQYNFAQQYYSECGVMHIFRDIMPRAPLKVNQSFRERCCLHIPPKRLSIFTDYTALYSKTQIFVTTAVLNCFVCLVTGARGSIVG
jgi:hypothetical protein